MLSGPFFQKMNRIDATPAAIELIAELRNRYGPLVFHQSGGCCDGSAPMCFERDEFIMGYSDVCLGKIDEVEFWMSKDQFVYWQYSHLTLDVVKGRGSSFSLEIPTGKRFIIVSRLFSEDELNELTPLKFKED